MPMLADPSIKYKKFPSMNLPNRQWPSKSLDKAPRWLATDLRDGNQSLPDPMSVQEKELFFDKLVEIGYKEIEVAFPSASQIDFDFTRGVVKRAPDDVWIQVLSPCREELIRRTIDSLKGAKKAIVHLYLATSECFRRIVFGMSEDESVELAVRCTKLVRSLTKDDPSTAGTEWQYEFSPETFSDSSPEFVIRICEAVKEAWGPTEENKIIFNLPATVEMSTPNVYADQIEYFCTNISERNKIAVSLHPHNDRGCAVAAAELAQMAGADRVEGCLFGNGERTGNVDLVTLGLNLYTQGISPKIDFSDILSIIKVVEQCNKIPVPERWPYGGQLVVSAFSGSHQDAIKKGFNNRTESVKAAITDGSIETADEFKWQIPYLPLDPKDIGRTYEAVIRVNSQSGKGGAAWIILTQLGLDLPRGLQIAFSKIVQKEAEKVGRELKSAEIEALFRKEYIDNGFTLKDYDTIRVDADTRKFVGVVEVDGREIKLSGTGNGPISAFTDALSNGFGVKVEVWDYKEHSIGQGSKVRASTFIEIKVNGQKARWGVGIHEDVVQASILSILSGFAGFL
ncbi:Leu42 alpha-isopropylmalate synthase [Myxozyma melibiosi]|uniref:2-isopropylmalate synthase n=1 Tax=Myxozyma melibiosi TaxID=54550 RepID=A0ABR1F4U9_9ASCO